MDIILNTTFDNPRLPILQRPGFIDSFERDAGTLVNTEDGKTWEQVGSAWGTTGDGAVKGSGEVLADAMSADGTLTVKLRKVDVDGDNRGGIAFRAIDRNNYIRISHNTSSSPTLMFYVIENASAAKTESTGVTLADGDVIAVSGQGSTIVIQVNGSTVFTYDTTDYLTATKHGLYSHSSNNNEYESIEFKL